MIFQFVTLTRVEDDPANVRNQHNHAEANEDLFQHTLFKHLLPQYAITDLNLRRLGLYIILSTILVVIALFHL